MEQEIYIILNIVPERLENQLQPGFYKGIKTGKGDVQLLKGTLLAEEENDYWSEVTPQK